MQIRAASRIKIGFRAESREPCIGNKSFSILRWWLFLRAYEERMKYARKKNSRNKKNYRYIFYHETMKRLQHINRKILSSRIQLSHRCASDAIGGVLELVVNCIP